MSRTILLAVVIAAVGAGIYYYLNQSEPTPSEDLQSAAQEAGEAVDDTAAAADTAVEEAADAATEETNQAASSIAAQASDAAEQAGQAATDLANQAGDEVAALAGQGQDLINSWIENGALTVQSFDYDAMVASVEESTLAQGVKTQVIQILDDIKASPETVALKIQELRDVLSGQ